MTKTNMLAETYFGGEHHLAVKAGIEAGLNAVQSKDALIAFVRGRKEAPEWLLPFITTHKERPEEAAKTEPEAAKPEKAAKKPAKKPTKAVLRPKRAKTYAEDAPSVPARPEVGDGEDKRDES